MTLLPRYHRLLACVFATLAYVLLLQMPTIAYAQEAWAAPEINSPTWLNSEPLRLTELRGKVVLVEFWTYGCSNCRNVEPYIKQWHERYAPQGAVIIGVHTPEFAHEGKIANVTRYVNEHEIRHAIAIDNDFAIWKRYRNRFWPTLYLIDKQGMVRYTHIGEGNYDKTEHQIRALLAEPWAG